MDNKQFHHGHLNIPKIDSILQHITNLEFELGKLKKRVKKLEDQKGKRNDRSKRGGGEWGKRD